MSIASTGQKATDSLNGKLTFEQDKNRIVGRDADNLIRLLILADGINFLMKTSKAGFDALTATNDQLIFNSDQNIFKIVSSGTTSITAPTSGNSTTVTVTHSLGFVPIGMFYVNNSSQFVPLPWTLWGTTSGKGSGELAIFVQSVTSTSLIFQINNWNAIFNGVAYPIKYYLLQETAN